MYLGTSSSLRAPPCHTTSARTTFPLVVSRTCSIAHGWPLHGPSSRDSSHADRLPARNSAFNVTEAAALQSFDHEGLPREVVYRIAQQVIRFEAHQQRIK